MRLNLSNLSYDAKWYDFETGLPLSGDPAPDKVYLKIRPRPLSRANVIFQGNSVILSGEDQCATFKYALVDWKNVHDADDKPLPCSPEVKQKIFDFGLGGIVPFVIRVVRDFEATMEISSKN